MRAEIARLSRRLGVRQVALVAIARVLGANMGNVSFADLVQLVQSQSERAAELQSQMGTLRTQIAALTDATVRGPAEQALARATTAFNEGRLDDADREFAALESLRRSESEAARAAWADAVEARAGIAALRLQFDLAEELRISAAHEEQRLASISIARQWQFYARAAAGRFEQGRDFGDNAALERAIVLFRDEALPLAPRAQRPLDWAATLNDLGLVYRVLGEREGGTARLALAIQAFNLALEETSRELEPQQWASTQNNLGLVFQALAQQENNRARLDQALAAFQAALQMLSREQVPLLWATVQNNLGNTLSALGEGERGTERLEGAVRAFSATLEEWTRERSPIEWAQVQINLGATYARLGERERQNEPVRLAQAIAAFEASLTESSRDRVPLQWAMAQNNLGNSLFALGELQRATPLLERALRAYGAALQEYRRERLPVLWALATANMAQALAVMGELGGDRAKLDAADRHLVEARAVLAPAGHLAGLQWVDYVRRKVAIIRRRMGN